MRAFARLALVVVTLLISSASARADPFVVTGGTIVIPSLSGPATFTLEGDGFSLAGVVSQSFGFGVCAPCSPTDPPRGIGGPLSDFRNGLPGTFNDVNYPAIFFGGVLQLSSSSFPVSMLLESTTVMLPFEFAGHLVGFGSSFAKQVGPALFSADFVGAGIVTANFSVVPPSPNFPSLFFFRDATFDFSAAQPEPTPEPATIALVAMGAATVLLRRRRHSSRSSAAR
jgi:hypothetical protein